MARQLEARMGLSHPCLPEIECIPWRNHRSGVLSSFIDLPSLASRIAPIEFREKCRISLQLIELLRAHHLRGFFLGKLSPSKVFYAGGRLRLNSTVPAAALDPGDDVDALRYCAPEYLSTGMPSERADLYSLGMLLYLLFSGRPPYYESHPSLLRGKLGVTHPTSLQRICPGVPEGIATIIAGLTSKLPGKRPGYREAYSCFERHCPGYRSLAVEPISALVGRATEFQALIESLEEVGASGSSKIVLLQGRAGIGKTRLLGQMALYTQLKGWSFVKVKHGPCSSLLSSFGTLSIGETSRAQEGAAAVSEAGTVEGIFKRLKSFAGRSGLVLLVENLNFADEGSSRLYQRLCTEPGMPLLLVGEVHTDISGTFWPYSSQDSALLKRILPVELSEFGESESSDYLSRLTRSTPQLRRLARHLALSGVRTPLEVSHQIEGMIRRGELEPSFPDWKWFPSQSAHAAAVPESAAAGSRLSFLPVELRELLLVLGLIREPAPLSIVSSILRLSPETTEVNLNELRSLGYVRLNGSLEDTRATLARKDLAPLLQGMASPEKLRYLHERIALEMEKGREKLEPIHREAITWHFLEAGRVDRAGAHLESSLQFLRDERLFERALELFERGLAEKVHSLEPWDRLQDYLELLSQAGRLEKCRGIAEKWLRSDPPPEYRKFLLGLLGKLLVARGRNREAVPLLSGAAGKASTPDSPEAAGELLGSYSLAGHEEEAQRTAAALFRERRRQLPVQQAAKLNHSLFAFLRFARRQFGGAALHWEYKAVRQSFAAGDFVRGTGRLCNIASSLSELGFWKQAASINRYCRDRAAEMGNRELLLYAEVACLAHLRRRGLHRAALDGCRNALEVNRLTNGNPRLEIELHLEVAKNSAHLLELENALEHLEKSRVLPESEDLLSVAKERLLTEALIRLLLGEAEKSLELACRAIQIQPGGEAGPALLLSARSRHLLGDLEAAFQDTRKALEEFTLGRPYLRTRTRILQSSILLSSGRPQEAAPYLTQAERLVREHYYLPQMAQASLLRAENLLAASQPAAAQARVLRARQILKYLDRPVLDAQAWALLGKCEEGKGDPKQARHSMRRARGVLRDPFVRMERRHQEGFRRVYLEKIGSHIARLHEASEPSRSGLLGQLMDFTSHLKAMESSDQIGKLILDHLHRYFPRTGFRLLLCGDDPRTVTLAGSRGSCRPGELGWLKGKLDHSRESLALRREDRSILVLSLGAPGRPRGYLYAEERGPASSELLYDYMQLLRGMAEPFFSPQTAESRLPNDRVGLAIGSLRMIGSHPCMLELFEKIGRVAASDATVMITGESGTGKELVARAIHLLSSRRRRLFRALNCAALQPALVENELFGHVRGSFTGASQEAKGLFQAASRGTLFLDEVSQLSPDLQAKLLRVLECGSVRKIGATSEDPVDTRVVAATNEDLPELIAKGAFRADLFYRLNVLPLEVPPLRRRLSDLRQLSDFFLEELNRANNGSVKIEEAALKRLESYPFPGNVRELKNALSRLYFSCSARRIKGSDVERWLASQRHSSGERRDRVERIVEKLLSGKADFWNEVRRPFLKRDLARSEVREIVRRGLQARDGSYRELVLSFGLQSREYKKFLSFLANHGCKVDFRPYRPSRKGEEKVPRFERQNTRGRQ